MKLHRISTVCSLLFAVGCGSAETIDSKDVPVRPPKATEQVQNAASHQIPPLSSAPLVQEIHQSYGLTYHADRQQTYAHAQFRVHNGFGDTIRFTNPSQVTFQGRSMDRVDGDAINTVVTVLNHLTIIPIFNLFRTGTFYTASNTTLMEGQFVFTDDYGIEVKTPVTIPSLYLEYYTQRVHQSDSSPVVEVKVRKASETAGELHCSLTSTWKDEDGQEHHESSSTKEAWEENRATCQFSGDEITKHLVGHDTLTLKIEHTLHRHEADPVQRTKSIRTSHVMERSIEIRN